MTKNNNGIIHQDLETVVLRKSKKQLDKDKSKSKNTTVSNKQLNSNKLQTKKIDPNDPDYFPEKKISHELKIQIQQARNKSGLSQKELAHKLGIQPNIVRDYESGKAVPNGQLLNKMSRILGTKLKK